MGHHSLFRIPRIYQNFTMKCRESVTSLYFMNHTTLKKFAYADNGTSADASVNFGPSFPCTSAAIIRKACSLNRSNGVMIILPPLLQRKNAKNKDAVESQCWNEPATCIKGEATVSTCVLPNSSRLSLFLLRLCASLLLSCHIQRT